MADAQTTTISGANDNPRAKNAPLVPEGLAATGIPAPPQKARQRKRGIAFRLILAVLAVGGAIWLVNFVHRSLIFEETDDAYISGHVHQVSSRVAGSVTEVLVKENEVVKAGQVLARIDPLEFQIALREAKAALAQDEAGVQEAQAALAQAKAQYAQAQAQEAASEAQVQRTEAQLQMANVNLGRDQRLYQNDVRAVSKADVDTSKSTADATTASLAAGKADVTGAQERVQAAEAAVESAQAAVTSANTKVDGGRAAVADAERQLSYAEIKAPSDGRIGNKNIEIGNRVQVGEALFAVVDKDCWITANFKETQLQTMFPGQNVEITVDAIGNQVFHGKLDSIAPASGAQFALLPPDNATGNFTKVVQRVPAKIVFDPDSERGFEDRLRPGLSAVVAVRVK